MENPLYEILNIQNRFYGKSSLFSFLEPVVCQEKLHKKQKAL